MAQMRSAEARADPGNRLGRWLDVSYVIYFVSVALSLALSLSRELSLVTGRERRCVMIDHVQILTIIFYVRFLKHRPMDVLLCKLSSSECLVDSKVLLQSLIKASVVDLISKINVEYLKSCLSFMYDIYRYNFKMS